MGFQEELDAISIKIGKKERKYIDSKYKYFNVITVVDKIKMMESIVGEVLTDCSEESELETLEILFIAGKY